MQILFVLPSAGGGGGAHSIVQEALGLNRLGLAVAIATPRHLSSQFRVRYPELEAHCIGNPTYGSKEELAAILAQNDLAIATTALSVQAVVEARDILEELVRPKLGYYVQDYEPLFYSPGTPEWHQARSSFELMKDGLIFAKTDWLCEVVRANHGLTVQRVQASIDHDIYFPRHAAESDRLRVTAMVRPQTPRRAPKRTLRILEQVAFTHPELEISYFGCDTSTLEALGMFTSAALTRLGALSRVQVASVLRHSDLFLDLSDFQAFGRTGLEGMACGCVPVLPIFGGATEYADHQVNSYLVDTRSDEEIIAAVESFVGGRPEQKAQMRKSAIETAFRYSVGKAAFSEYELFREFLRS